MAIKRSKILLLIITISHLTS